MICFKCNKNKNNIEELKFHLKDKHNLKENDLYKCGFKECQQEFNKSSSFYRHLRTLHKSNEVESIQINKSNESNAFECSKSEIQDFSNDTSDTNLSSSFNEEQAFDDIKQSDNTNEFEEIFFHFLTTLHSNPSLTKKTIQQIFTNVKNQIIDRILNYANNSDLRRKIGISYSKYDSYYKYQKKVEEKGFLSKAKQEVISQKISPIYRKGKIVYDVVKEKIVLLPIKQQMKYFLELPNVLASITKHMDDLRNDIIISNFIQGETWKKIRSEYKPEDTVIPCFLNHDDFEPDNPLGSNAGNNKIAAFYYTFPVIPHYLLSSPNFIFDGSLFSSHLKNEDLKSCVEPLVNIFVDLETNGIDLNIDNNEKKVYIVLCLLLGDNLAINEMLGLSKSFNSNYFCRFCTILKDESKQTVKECDNSLRSIDTYVHDLESKHNGIISDCYFRKLKYFHPITNYEIDVMHDLYEGVARYDLALILQSFIYEKKLFNLNTLNQIKQTFEYGEIEIGNLGKELTESQLKKGYIIMSASKMKAFLEVIPLMIAHLVPEKNVVWLLLLQLCNLSDQLFKSKFTENEINVLEKNITLYLERRTRIFGKTLKPKHHFLTHACRCIRKSGPLKFLSCFPFEQRNRITKHYANVCFQRKNLAWSLSYKSATNFNNFLKNHENGFPLEMSYKEKHKTSLTYEELLNQNYINHEILRKIDHDKLLFKLSCLDYKSTTFKIGFCIAINKDHKEIECFKIIDFLLNDDKYYIVGQKQFVKYNTHSQSYLLQRSSSFNKLILFEELDYFPFNMHSNVTGEIGFRLKSL